MPLQDSSIVGLIKRFPQLVRIIKASQRQAGLLARPYYISRYMKQHTVRKLQIGAHVCVLPGWLNTDLYPQSIRSVTLDATRRFPFPDQSFDYVFSEHQLEHISYEGALSMLRECHRILRSGGKIRIALPSLDRLVELFASDRNGLQERYIRHVTQMCYPGALQANACFAINSAFMNWGHRFLYDRATLTSSLENAGFSQVQFFAPGVSDDANLQGIETRTSETDAYETMVAQAVRL